MNVFISGPALTSAENNAQCVRLRWWQDHLVFFFVCFQGFEAENQKKKWDTKQPLTTICEGDFL